ncbi:hypothetical protein LZC95_50860 [Pendulispora brunnea]|uniref:PRTRC system protein F n=1 Tax=Pendulispora brunnea TaxID=2905690 RepID=A0ABZ2K7T6_9BACT
MYFKERLDRKFGVIAEAERFGAALVAVNEERGEVAEYLFRNGTGRHFYAEGHSKGPMDGLHVHPGEHHAILPCGAPAPAAFLPAQGSWCSSDAMLARTLDQLEGTLALRRLNWNWYTTRGGRSYYPAKWGVQLRPLASGAHLIVRGIQGGVFDVTTVVGISSFLRIAWAIQSALHNAPLGAPAHESYPSAFGELAYQRLYDEVRWIDTAPAYDVASALNSLFSPLAGDEVTLGEVSAKRAKLVREALPASEMNARILGVLGSGGALQLTKALVLTPTHGFLRYEFVEGGVRRSFPWSDVIAADAASDEGDVFLLCKRLGWIPIPGCGRAREVANAFQTLIAIMQQFGQAFSDQPAEVDMVGLT